eukprot:m.66609 g.66609  ORF g.66609 m.66609 type:complete len:56 (+) comp9824_c0_seq2:3263-3430(+)
MGRISVSGDTGQESGNRIVRWYTVSHTRPARVFGTGALLPGQTVSSMPTWQDQKC